MKQTQTYSLVDGSRINIKKNSLQNDLIFAWECGNEIHPWDVIDDLTGKKLYSFEQLK